MSLLPVANNGITETPMIKKGNKSAEKHGYGKPFYLIVAFLVFEYTRIHTLLGPIEYLHLPLIVSLLILFSLFTGKLNFGNLQTKCFLGLIVLMIFHVPLAVNNYWAFQTVKTMGIYLVVHIAVVTYITSHEMLRKLTNVLLLCALFICILGIFKRGVIGGSGFYNDENDFSLAMNIFLPIAYFRFLENPRRNILSLVMSGAFLFGTVISFSRGGFLGLCAVISLIWIKSSKKMLASLAIMSFVIFVYYTAPPRYWTEINTITEEGTKSGTGAVRLYTWKAAWRMFVDNPIFGVGPGNFPWNFEKYEPVEGYKGVLHGGRASHSVYFTLIPELGLIGTVLFSIIIFSNYKSLRVIMKRKRVSINDNHPNKRLDKQRFEKNSNHDISVKNESSLYYDSYGILGAFAGYLVSGIFLSVLYYPHFWILTSLTTAMSNIARNEQIKD